MCKDWFFTGTGYTDHTAQKKTAKKMIHSYQNLHFHAGLHKV